MPASGNFNPEADQEKLEQMEQVEQTQDEKQDAVAVATTVNGLGTDQNPFFPCQIRIGGNTAKIQLPGGNTDEQRLRVNTPYGVSGHVMLTPDLAKLLAMIQANKPSLNVAEGSHPYFAAQLRLDQPDSKEMSLVIQVPCQPEKDTDYTTDFGYEFGLVPTNPLRGIFLMARARMKGENLEQAAEALNQITGAVEPSQGEGSDLGSLQEPDELTEESDEGSDE